jgi:hypothetical protein
MNLGRNEELDNNRLSSYREQCRRPLNTGEQLAIWICQYGFRELEVPVPGYQFSIFLHRRVGFQISVGLWAVDPLVVTTRPPRISPDFSWRIKLASESIDLAACRTWRIEAPGMMAQLIRRLGGLDEQFPAV